MPLVTREQKDAFFLDVEAAAKKATWCAVATVEDNEPRVRMVHPTWQGDLLWIATAPESAKARQLQNNAAIDIQFQVASPDFIHLMVRGTATVLNDQETKDRVWDIMDYDLADFWPGGRTDPGFVAIRVEASRVELSELFGTMNKRVWKP
ncbi:MAG: pyridoxamine 5'-phosphate oxidase family protein [Halioglobus sp.]